MEAKTILTTNEKLAKLRQKMAQNKLTAYYINTADPHQSEYVADHFKNRAWLTGFTGSAGYALVTADAALLWVDGRYYIQAAKQIAGSEFEMMKMGNSDYPTLNQYLAQTLRAGDSLGVNGEMVSQKAFEDFQALLNPLGVDLKSDLQLVEDIWSDRPPMPQSKVFVHEPQYTGLTAAEKVDLVREKMAEDGVESALYAGLNDICWLFNIRADDIKNTPVVISYALISRDGATLYVDQSKLDQNVQKHLAENGITVRDYAQVFSDLEQLESKSLVVDKNMVNHKLFAQVPEGVKILDKTDYPYAIKSCLNPVELENQRRAYVRDAVALTKFIYYVKKNVGKVQLDELKVEEVLHNLRAEQENFLDDSFSTIAAYGPNAAMMHYSASPESFSQIQPSGFLLVDSGGHYLDGTTDITRTISCGPLTDEEIRDYSLTLKSHINLARAVFLSGVTGYYLDVLARQPLWQHHMDYKCGTGHGVGYLLSVHEGPQRFNMTYKPVPLHPGMVITNEPGVYKEGSHGIRLENDYVVAEDQKVGADQYLKLDCLSFVPFDRAAIDTAYLEGYEVDWFNAYQKKVYDLLSPYLTESERAWLESETQPLDKK